jgi:hypothetical protein
MYKSTRSLVAAITAATLSIGGHASAGLFRAYLSVDGNDANPCTVQQPCRLLPAAIAAVDDGGEIWMVDSANYNTGPVTITKSVSILAIPGAVASVVGNGGNAIQTGTPGVRIALRNLKILSLAGAWDGIHLANGASLTVDGCEIAGFNGATRAGIYVQTAAVVTIVDTVVRDGNDGIRFDGGATGTVIRTTVVRNSGAGIIALPTFASSVKVTIVDSVSSHNGSYGYCSSIGIPSMSAVAITPGPTPSCRRPDSSKRHAPCGQRATRSTD